MKPTMLLFAAFLLPIFTFAQPGLGIGTRYSHFSASHGSSSQLTATIPSVFYFVKSKSYLAAGLDKMSLVSNRPSAPYDGRTFEIILSPFVEYGVLLGAESKKLKYRLGARGTLGNVLRTFRPNTTTQFPTDYFESAVSLAITPGILFPINKRLIFNAGFAIDLLRLGYSSSFTENPSIPVRQQRARSWSDDYFPGSSSVFAGLIFLPFKDAE
jgi:hypothetical protein